MSELTATFASIGELRRVLDDFENVVSDDCPVSFTRKKDRTHILHVDKDARLSPDEMDGGFPPPDRATESA